MWDIDGTLVHAAGIGREALDEAFAAVTGAPPERVVPFAGRTDLEIALDLLGANGADAAESVLPGFQQALEASLAAKLPMLRERGRALPGAAQALTALGRQPGVLQSLLTGNIAPNALVKLSAFGLERHVDFEIGAYGSDHRRRGELVAIARRKAAAKHGAEVAPHDVVLIGDTPLDVAAAREGGARAVGVATGPYDAPALREAGADVVLDDLTDPLAVVQAALGR